MVATVRYSPGFMRTLEMSFSRSARSGFSWPIFPVGWFITQV